MAQPLKAPHLAGTETSLPGHRFPALSPRAARRAHAELRSPPPRVWLKARHPQPRGKANVCAAPRRSHPPPRREGRHGTGLKPSRSPPGVEGRMRARRGRALPLPAATGRSRPPSGPPPSSAPGPAVRQRSEAAAAPAGSPPRRAATLIPAAAGPAPPRPALPAPPWAAPRSPPARAAGPPAALSSTSPPRRPSRPVPSRRPPLRPPLARRRHGQLGGAAAQALLRPSAGGPARGSGARWQPGVASSEPRPAAPGRPSAPAGFPAGSGGKQHSLWGSVPADLARSRT